MSEEELLAIAYERGLNPGKRRQKDPYRPRAKWTTFDETKRNEFLMALAESGNISYACRRVGVPRTTLDKYRNENAEYNEFMDDALAYYADTVVGAAHQRAVHGYTVPIVGGRNKDEIVAHEVRYSDSLMAMMLKTVDPRFNPTQKVEVSGQAGLIDPAQMNFRNMSKRAKRVLRVLLNVIKEDDAMRADGIDPNSVLDQGYTGQSGQSLPIKSIIESAEELDDAG